MRIDVTPQNLKAAVAALSHGATLSFAPGHYDLAQILGAPITIDNLHNVTLTSQSASRDMGYSGGVILDYSGLESEVAIVLQGTRDTTIRGLSFIGPNNYQSTLDPYELWNDAAYLAGGRENRYSPCAGVVIDPFFDGAPAGNVANRYPGLDAHYVASSGFMSSTEWTIENCDFRHSLVGVMNSPSGNPYTQNSEAGTVKDCTFLGVRVGYATGHDQTKGCVLNHCRFAQVQYAQDALRYGQQKGYPAIMRDCMVEGSYGVINMSQNTPFVCDGLFAEEILTIGTLSYGGHSIPKHAIFTGCEFAFQDAKSMPSGQAREADAHLMSIGHSPLFSGCTFARYDNGTLRIFAHHVTLDHCTLAYIKQLSPMVPSRLSVRKLADGGPTTQGGERLTADAFGYAHTALGVVDMAVADGRATFADTTPGCSVGDVIYSVADVPGWLPKLHGPEGYTQPYPATNLAIGVVSDVDDGVVTVDGIAHGFAALTSHHGLAIEKRVLVAA